MKTIKIKCEYIFNVDNDVELEDVQGIPTEIFNNADLSGYDFGSIEFKEKN